MAIGHIEDLGALVRMIRMARIEVLIRYRRRADIKVLIRFDSNTATGPYRPPSRLEIDSILGVRWLYTIERSNDCRLGFDSNTATGCIEVLAIVARALTNC